MLKRFLLKFYVVLLFVFIASSTTIPANAADPVFRVKGNVYAGYSAIPKKDAPLGGMIVELFDANDQIIGSTLSASNGSYTLRAPSAGLYRVKVSSPNKDAPNNLGDKAVATSGNIFLKPQSTESTGNDIFYYGSGGKVILYTYIEDSSGPLLDHPTEKIYGYKAQNIEATFSLNNDQYNLKMAAIKAKSGDQGYIELNNVIKGVTYKGVVSNSGIPASLNNYVLWRTSQYKDDLDFLIFGTTATEYLLLHEKSPAGIDLIVANDQNLNGVYNYGVDTPAYGVKVRLYYQGTTRPIAGLPEYIIGPSNSDITNASISIRNLPEGKYTVGVAAEKPWKITKQDNTNFEIIKTTAVAPKSTILLQVDESSSVKLPGASGYVYILGADEIPGRTPDSEQVSTNKPSGSSSIIASMMDLYIYNNDQWQKLSELNSGQYPGKRYRFSGLLPNRDYKIVQRTTPNTSAYVFVNDTDGKSNYRQVTLSTGDSETINGREIILPNLKSNELTQQNFWYSYINSSGSIRIIPGLLSLFNLRTWGGEVHGGGNNSMTTYTIATVYEEDGKTPTINRNGNAVAPVTHLSASKPFSTMSLSNILIDHAGVFWIKTDTPTYELANEHKGEWFGKSSRLRDYYPDMTPKNANKISGYIFINNSGTTNNYVKGTDIPLPSSRVVLKRKNPDGSYQTVTVLYSSDESRGLDRGYYELTNLPNGDYIIEHTKSFGATRDVDAGDIVLQGNSSGSAKAEQIKITLTGGQNITEQNFWYRNQLTSYTIRGQVLLDTNNVKGALDMGKPNNENDLPLFGANVYLCIYTPGQLEQYCIDNKIATRVVGVSGSYLFDSAKIPGMVPGKQYRIVARRDYATPITNTTANIKLASSYILDIVENDFLPKTRHFLFKTTVGSDYTGTGVIDFNGNVALDGGAGGEERLGISNPINLYYQDSANNWIFWANIRKYWNNWGLYYLPPGKYRQVITDTPTQFVFTGNYNGATAPNVVEFTVGTDGKYVFKGSLDGDIIGSGINRHIFGGNTTSVTAQGVSGRIYLQVGDIIREPTQQELQLIAPSGLKVKGYLLSRFYKNIRTKPTNDQLREPDFIDNNVGATGTYAYTASTSRINNRVYLSSYLLRLEGLREGVSVIRNSGESKNDLDPAKVILPDGFKSDNSYMWVRGKLTGAIDQHYYVRIDNLSVISGRLYYDYDKNNLYDKNAGDIPMANVTVNLLKQNNSGQFEIYGTIRTDVDGFYQFDGMPAGKYIVQSPKTYEEIIAPKEGSVNGLSPDYKLIIPASGKTGTITIVEKNEVLYTDNDFYYTNIEFSTITGSVALDLDNDGLLTNDKNGYKDLPVKDVTVYLYKTNNPAEATGVPYMQVKTDIEGRFKFTDIPDQNQPFIIKVIPDANYGVISSYNADTPNPGMNVSDLLSVHVTVKDDIDGNNFLLAGRTNTYPAGGITDNAALTSGVYGYLKYSDTGDFASGIKIGLYDRDKLTADGKPTLIAQRITDDKGEYHFYNLDNSRYTVKIMLLPEDVLVINNAQTNQNDYLHITLNNNGLAEQFFLLQEVSKGIQGFVYVDFANNTPTPPPAVLADDDHPIDGITLELYEGFDATGPLLKTTETGFSVNGELAIKGKYKFNEIDAGKDYSVKLIIPASYIFKTSTGEAVDGTATASYQYIINIKSLPQDGVENVNFFMAGNLVLRGDVWLNDVDENGWNLVKDDGEEVNNASVQLYYLPPEATDEVYVLLKNTVTNTTSSNKGYNFGNIAPGDYRILVPDGVSKANALGKPPATSEALKYGVLIPGLSGNVNPIQIYDLATNQNELSTGFEYKGRIAGTAIIDADNNNVFHTNADGRFEFLDLTASAMVNGKEIIRNAQTLVTSGTFLFSNLPPADAGYSWILNVKDANQQSVIADLEHYRLAFSKIGNDTITEPTLPLEIGQNLPTVSGIVIAYTGQSILKGCLVYDYQLGNKSIDASKDIPLNNIKINLISQDEAYSSMPPKANDAFSTTSLITGDPVKNWQPGCFEFNNLSNYNYRIYIDPDQDELKGYQISFNPVNFLINAQDDTTDVLNNYDIKPSGAKNEVITNIDFGYKGLRHIDGYVTRDVDINGELTTVIDEDGNEVIVDPAFPSSTPVTLTLTRTEPALPSGATVQQPVFSLNSDLLDGHYLFDNVGPGKWILKITSAIPSDYEESYSPENDEYVFNPNNGNTQENNQTITDINYGFIGKSIFKSTLAYDYDPSDGLYFVSGTDEPITGKDNITVILSGPDGFSERTTIVDPNTGKFEFDKLDNQYSLYQVSISTDLTKQPTFPPGWRPAYGPYQTDTSNVEFVNSVVIDWAKESTVPEQEKYFGFRNDGRISGKVFRDINPDDSETVNATGMAAGDALFPTSYDVKVTAISEDGSVRIVKSVNEDGSFVFNNLGKEGFWYIYVDDGTNNDIDSATTDTLPTGHEFSYAVVGTGGAMQQIDGHRIKVKLSFDGSAEGVANKEASGLHIGLKGQGQISGQLVIDSVFDQTSPVVNSLQDIDFANVVISLYEKDENTNDIKNKRTTRTDNQGNYRFEYVNFNSADHLNWFIDIDFDDESTSPTNKALLTGYELSFKPADDLTCTLTCNVENGVIISDSDREADHYTAAKLKLTAVADVSNKHFAVRGTQKVSGIVFRDMNPDDGSKIHDYDSYFNEADTLTVSLINTAKPDAILTTVVTYDDIKGKFEFDHVAEGDWLAYISDPNINAAYPNHLPANHEFSFALLNYDPVTPSGLAATVVTDKQIPIKVKKQEDFSGIALGYKGTGTLAGLVGIDIDPDLMNLKFNLSQDKPLTGITITLYDDSREDEGISLLSRTAITDENGAYQFTGLTFNPNWRIMVNPTNTPSTNPNISLLNGYSISFRPKNVGQGGIYDEDENGHPIFVSDLALENANMLSTPITEKNFGFKGLATLNGKVTRDIDVSHDFTEGLDLPFPSDRVAVLLTASDTEKSFDGSTIVRRVLTSNEYDGTYTFAGVGLGAWSFSIDIASVPALYNSDELSYYPDTVSIDTTTINIDELDIGIKGAVTYSGYLVYDKNPMDGYQYNTAIDEIIKPIAGDIYITLTSQNENFNSKYDVFKLNGDAVPADVGLYQITDLDPNYDGYIVAVDTSINNNFPSGWIPSFVPYQQAATNGGEVNIDWSKPITNNHFGFITSGSISGYVLRDMDPNDVDNTAPESIIRDLPISGVKVTLTNLDNPADIRTTFTGDGLNNSTAGYYIFEGILPGNWDIKIDTLTEPAGTLPSNHDLSYVTPAESKTAGAVTSQVTGSNSVKLTISQMNTQAINANFGLKGKGTISGTVVIDVDPGKTSADAAIDTGSATDLRLKDVTVILTNDADEEPVIRKAITDNNGLYSFNDVTYGQWTLVIESGISTDNESSLKGYTINFKPKDDTTGNGSETDGVIEESTDVRSTLKLNQADVVITSKNFGFKSRTVLLGHVTRDIDVSGDLTNVDLPFATEQTIILTKTDISPAIVRTVKTSIIADDRGSYIIDGILPGKWELEVVTPTNYSLSYLPASYSSNNTTLNFNFALDDIGLTDLDFGFKGQGSFAGYLAKDININDGYAFVSGIDEIITPSSVSQPIYIQLSSWLDNDSDFTTRSIALDPSTGEYQIDGLDPQYHGYLISMHSTDSKNAGFPKGWEMPSFNPYGTNTAKVRLDWSKGTATNNNYFGFRNDSGIVGSIYRDMNPDDGANGITHDALFEDIKVCAINSTTAENICGVTDDTGDFTLVGLSPGIWQLQLDSTSLVAVKHEYSYSVLPKTNSYVTANGEKIQVTIDAINNKYVIGDIGFGIKGKAVISGKVAIDIDPQTSITTITTNDILLENVVVALTNGNVTRYALTDHNGKYTFNGVTFDDNWKVNVDPNLVTDLGNNKNSLGGYSVWFRPMDDFSGNGSQANPGKLAVGSEDNEFALLLDKALWLSNPLIPQVNGRDFGFTGAGTISGLVFRDMDSRDGSDSVKSYDKHFENPVTVTLVNANDSNIIYKTQSSNIDGSFRFDYIAPGSWRVFIDDSSSNNHVPPNHVFSYALDEQSNTVGKIITVNLTEEITDISGLSFGFKGTRTVSGQVVIDMIADLDPTLDSTNDIGLGDIQVTLFDDTDADNIIELTTNTIASGTNKGKFTFNNISYNPNWKIKVDSTKLPNSDITKLGKYRVYFRPADNDLSNLTGVLSVDYLDFSTKLPIYTISAINIENRNFGFIGTGSVRGQIFRDMNASDSKILHSYDKYFNNPVTVTLINLDQPNVKYTTKTNPSSANENERGQFIFNDISNGRWGVYISDPSINGSYPNHVPVNHTFSYGLKKANSASPELITAKMIEVVVSDEAPIIDNLAIGFKGLGKVIGKVVIDVDPDGDAAVDPADIGIAGIELTLQDSTGQVMLKTKSGDGANGSVLGEFTFDNVTYHDWVLYIDNTSEPNLTLLKGYTVNFRPSDDTTGNGAPLPTHLRPGADDKPLTATTLISETGLKAYVDGIAKAKNFAFKGRGIITGQVLRALSGNQPSNIDDGLAGVTVRAQNGGVVREAITSVDGSYTIDGLNTGKWQVTIDESTLPLHFQVSYVNAIGDGVTETPVINGVEIDIDQTVTRQRSAVSNSKVYFGIKAGASIQGQVVIDIDDAIPNPADIDVNDISVIDIDDQYTVRLYTNKSSTPIRTIAPSATDIGNISNTGIFIFDGLFSGVEYKVEVLAPKGYIASFNFIGSPVISGSDSIATTNEVMSQSFTLSAANTVFTGSRFGWKNRSGIAGRIFLDSNDNGEFDGALDQAIASSSLPVIATLDYLDGTLPQITRTLTNGPNYQITGLQPGKWRITLSGITGITHYRASFDADDSYSHTKLPKTAETAVVTIEEGKISQADFGYIEGGLLSGVIKEDSKPEGHLVSSQPGITGVVVKLLDDLGMPIMVSGTTNAIVSTSDQDGLFAFRNLDVTKDYKVQISYLATDDNPLIDMYPTFDSSYNNLEVIPTTVGIELPWMGSGVTMPSTVDMIQQLHTIDAKISQAAANNHELTPDDIYFGYVSPFGDLVIQKAALKDQVKVGEIVPYRITIINNSNISARNIEIHDLIPPGFAFVKGSVRLDGEKDVTVKQSGRTVIVSGIDLGGANGSGTVKNIRTLNYFLTVGAGVTEGDYINTAVAKSRSGKIVSAESKATVTVAADPLFDDSLIFGTVYVDSNQNGIQDNEEKGLSGIKLITARGEIITTDKAGRFHLVDVNGGRWGRGTNFILKLDLKTLPRGYKLISRNPVVVRLSPGLPSKIDFRIIKIDANSED